MKQGKSSVRSLLCHRDVDLAVHCFESVLSLSADPVEMVIHEDGSLTEADCALIQEKLPGSRIVPRKHADEVMREKLRGHPNALNFREGSVWGLKLLDVVLAEPGMCLYMDGDIRFFRPFRGLFTDEATRGRCVFLRDTVWQAYSIRPWHLTDKRGLQVVSGINTGLTLCDPEVFDLDYVDWFLAQSDWRVIPAWTEPTCWAALAMRAKGHAVNSRQIVNLYRSATLTPEAIGGHFLSAHRRFWERDLYEPLQTDSPVIDVRMQALEGLHPLWLGMNQLKRKLQNTVLVNKWIP
jgi:hypothetical protein